MGTKSQGCCIGAGLWVSRGQRVQGAGAKQQKQGQGQVAAPFPGGRVIAESSKPGVCWSGSVLNTLLSRHVREEINQLLIYLGGQILLFNCFLIWSLFPGLSVQMSPR